MTSNRMNRMLAGTLLALSLVAPAFGNAIDSSASAPYTFTPQATIKDGSFINQDKHGIIPRVDIGHQHGDVLVRAWGPSDQSISGVVKTKRSDEADGSLEVEWRDGNSTTTMTLVPIEDDLWK